MHSRFAEEVPSRSEETQRSAGDQPRILAAVRPASDRVVALMILLEWALWFGLRKLFLHGGLKASAPKHDSNTPLGVSRDRQANRIGRFRNLSMA
jgi:hypothetical protein